MHCPTGHSLVLSSGGDVKRLGVSGIPSRCVDVSEKLPNCHGDTIQPKRTACPRYRHYNSRNVQEICVFTECRWNSRIIERVIVVCACGMKRGNKGYPSALLSDQIHAAAALLPRETAPHAFSLRGCVDPRYGLVPTGTRTPTSLPSNPLFPACKIWVFFFSPK
jgi:hypothetical protein